jgi:uncharacterized damage-inducible protein DinB
MMKSTPWIERSFPLDAPRTLIPGTLERLRGTPARAEDRLAPLPPDLLTRRPEGSGAWSIQEHAGHLLKLEPLWDGRLDDFAAGLDALRPADMTNRATYEAAFNAVPLEQILAEFRAARSKFVARVENLDAAGHERVALHPRLQKPMRVIDLMLFIAEHDDHHLAKISGLIDQLDRERRAWDSGVPRPSPYGD